MMCEPNLQLYEKPLCFEAAGLAITVDSLHTGKAILNSWLATARTDSLHWMIPCHGICFEGDRTIRLHDNSRRL